MNKRSVVVTGASTGIGWATTKVLVESGFHVFGSVRKGADAERLVQAFGDGVTPLLFDVTDEAAVREAALQVEAVLGGTNLAGLVNNAGVAVAGPLLHLPLDEWRKQLDVNLTGVVIATQAFAPLVGARKAAGGPAGGTPGRIVNIGSVGGRNANPFMAPYCTTKFGLEGLSESLRRELLPFGVDVVVIAPGAVATPIWDKADEIDTAAYAGTVYAPALERLRAYMLSIGKSGLAPEVIGQAVRTALTAPRPKTRYTLTPQPFQFWLGQVLPKRMVDQAIGKRLGLLEAP
ncbi:MAG: SDR family NAD(P)-dependent oxidoreductase [Caulobacter sp.]|nr:SDR family NAD(P)-dependent oxidoreductase [Caulobacter sp.]